ncbi:MAG: type II secretion system protein [Myxococcales bacterium]
MSPRYHRDRKPTKGFTLIELGIVLGVTAILATAVLPDIIEAARSKMAERTAADIAVLQDAARWYFSKSLLEAEGVRGRWPAENIPNTCPVAVDPLVRLRNDGYLTIPPKNPWGFDYQAALVILPGSGSGGQVYDCSFEVSTEIPRQLRTQFKKLVPQGQCNDDPNPKFTCRGTASSVDNIMCCSFIAKPGFSVNPCPPGFRPRGSLNSPITCVSNP